MKIKYIMYIVFKIIAVCPVVCEGSMKKGKFQCFIISAISPARLGPDLYLSALI